MCDYYWKLIDENTVASIYYGPIQQEGTKNGKAPSPADP